MCAKTPRRQALPELEALVDLSGKTALVTGAAAGIGRAITYRLAEAGADLILVDRSAEGLAQVAKEMEPWGRKVELHTVDLSSRQAIAALWEKIGAAAPDILVNNAGSYPARDLMDVDGAFYEKVFSVNLDAVFWMCQGMVRGRKRKGGVIVNIGSIEAVMPFKADMAVYSMSKSGVIALTRALAAEYASKGFRVNVVVPGGIDTPGTRSMALGVLKGNVGLIKEGYDYQQRLPAKRMGKPDDVARVVLFLACDLSSYMHGAAIPVDGGFLSR